MSSKEKLEQFVNDSKQLFNSMNEKHIMVMQERLKILKNAKKSAEGESELKPCPFCGSQPEFDDAGTQLELVCNGCRIASVSIQISDLMSIDERCNDNNWDGRHYKTEFVERAKKESIAKWNDRT